MTHDKVNNSPRRLTIAAPRPKRYASWRFASGRRCTMMAMNTMLSIPSTISSPASAARLSKIVGSDSCSSTPEPLSLSGPSSRAGRAFEGALDVRAQALVA